MHHIYLIQIQIILLLWTEDAACDTFQEFMQQLSRKLQFASDERYNQQEEAFGQSWSNLKKNFAVPQFGQLRYRNRLTYIAEMDGMAVTTTSDTLEESAIETLEIKLTKKKVRPVIPVLSPRRSDWELSMAWNRPHLTFKEKRPKAIINNVENAAPQMHRKHTAPEHYLVKNTIRKVTNDIYDDTTHKVRYYLKKKKHNLYISVPVSENPFN